MRNERGKAVEAAAEAPASSPQRRSVWEHKWFRPVFIAYDCCAVCGISRRADDQNEPCRGVVRIGLRESPDCAGTGQRKQETTDGL